MEVLTFAYDLLYDKTRGREDEPIDPAEQPLNTIAEVQWTGPTQAVVWDWPARQWTFRPDVAAAILYGNPERHRFRPVDRQTAERETSRFATIPLPSEEELTEICRAATRT